MLFNSQVATCSDNHWGSCGAKWQILSFASPLFLTRGNKAKLEVMEVETLTETGRHDATAELECDFFLIWDAPVPQEDAR